MALTWRWSSGHVSRMSKLLLCVFVAVGLVVGCKKKEAVALKPAPTPPPTTLPAKTPQEAVKMLNSAILNHTMTGGKRPSSLDEFLKLAGIRELPPLPPGRKYVFDPKSCEVAIK